MGRFADTRQMLSALAAAARERTDPLFRRLSEFLESKGLSERDIRALKIGALALGAFLLFSLYGALFSGGDSMKDVGRMRAQLREIRELKEEYRYSRDILAGMGDAMQEEGDALISVVEKALMRNGVDPNSFSIKGTNPGVKARGIERERAVLVKINKVEVPRVLNVLYIFQKSDTLLKVSDLRIKTRFDDPTLTDVSFRLSTFSFSQAG